MKFCYFILTFGMYFAYMLNSMNEISEALENLNLYPVKIEVSKEFTGYFADKEEPMEFQSKPLAKPKPKKRSRFVGWRRVRRKKPATRKVTKTEEPKDKGKGVEIEENVNQVEIEAEKSFKQTEREVGESSRQKQKMTPWEVLDHKLVMSDLIGPADGNLEPANPNLIFTEEDLFSYPLEAPIPINLEPAIPDPIVQPQPLPVELDEWWTTDWQYQNLLNNPDTFFPQVDPEPPLYPTMSAENLAELRLWGEELINTGNRIRDIGERVTWKYDERERQF